MNIDQRIRLLSRLGQYMAQKEDAWETVKERAVIQNAWFTPTFIEEATNAICTDFLQESQLRKWIAAYPLPEISRKVGIVMAGNIPLVGFHDLLCCFICGHQSILKLSTKDAVLLPHLIAKLTEWDPEIAGLIQVSEMLKGCDAYIATGSNNTARYFEQYFEKYPHIIRRNRTSVAVLDGTETQEDFQLLGGDIFKYFGLGCRNVTQICVPGGYDFTPLLQNLESWKAYFDHNKYRNNFDYHLALYLLNRVPYLDNGFLLLVENELPFSAVSVLHYRYYDDKDALLKELAASKDIQAIIGKYGIPFGKSQEPALGDYADGVDTMAFLCQL